MKAKGILVNAAFGVTLATSISMATLLTHQYRQTLSLENQCQKLEAQISCLNETVDEKGYQIFKLENILRLNDAKVKESENIQRQNDKLQKQNDELQKQNDLLSQYHSAIKKSMPSRGMSYNKHIKLVKIKVEVSAYTSFDPGCDFYTASGSRVHWGVVAAPKEIAMGTHIMIPEYFPDTVFVKEDTGGYIKKVGDTYRIDIWFADKQEAANFGRRWTEAYIVINKEE
jgi:3D (Asp-Asp-Asp) domain-containing protein